MLKYFYPLLLLSFLYMSCGESGDEFEVGNINLTVDKNVALAGNDTITITAEVLGPNSARLEGVPLDYFADDVKLPSNLFIPTEAGSFILSARYQDVNSKVQKVEVVSLDNPVDELTIKYNGVPYLTTNEWSLSAKFDKQIRVGSNVFNIENDVISLFANDQLLSADEFIHFDEPGVYEVQAELNGQRSNKIEINVRPALDLEVIEIPIVYHTYGFRDEIRKLEEITDFLNRIYNAQSFPIEEAISGNINPNAANMYIKFVMAETAPEGRELTSKGVHYTPLINENRLSPNKADVDEALALHNWDPEQYINIWIFKGWDFNDDDYSEDLIREGRGMFTPPILVEERLDGLSTVAAKETNENSFIGLLEASLFGEHPDYTHTVLGYYLGLFNIDQFGCALEGDYCPDTHTFTPSNDANQLPSGNGYSCDEYFYRINNFMSFNLHYTNFTYDQRERMRTVLAHGNSRPSGI